MDIKDFEILPAAEDFDCGICGTRVKKGDSCLVKDGSHTCLCVLPTRRLSATGTRRPLLATN